MQMDLAMLRKLYRPKLALYGSLALLCIATLYSAWYANYYLSGNSDDVIYPYLFQHFKAHDLVLPGQHANILKFPLFILQAVTPYNFTTFSIVSIGLVVTTVLGWALLLIWLFGKRWASLISLSLTALLLGSQLFNYDILGTTIRNIEFPIVLAFIIFAGKLLKRYTLSRKELITGGVIALLFSLTIAGDSFFLYTICSSLLVTLGYFWFIGEKDGKQKPQYAHSLIYVVGATISSFIIRLFIKLLGVQYYTAGVFKPHILPLNHLGLSLSTAATQVLDLFGANIFGQAIRPGIVLSLLNFFLLALGLIGVIYMLKDTFCAESRKLLVARIAFSRVFIFAALGLTAVVSFSTYIASDLVVSETPQKTITSLYQERYLTIIPLLLTAGIIYFVWRKFEKRQLVFIGLPIIIAAGLLVGGRVIVHSHAYNGSLREGPITIAKAAKEQHVQVALTGYWYGAVLRFWSHNSLDVASVAACNIPQPTFNTRLSWYKPSAKITTTALVVVHSGVDATYWNCPDELLRQIYGDPVKIVHIPTGDQPDLWIYHYDVRSKVLPMQF